MARRLDMSGVKEDGRMKDAKSRRRRRGAVQVEYAFLLLFVMVPAAAVLLVGGRLMYQTYQDTRTAILNSSP